MPRPRLPNDVRRDQQVLVQLTRLERRAIRRAARLSKDTMSSWVRAAIHKALSTEATA